MQVAFASNWGTYSLREGIWYNSKCIGKISNFILRLSFSTQAIWVIVKSIMTGTQACNQYSICPNRVSWDRNSLKNALTQNKEI